jgi:DNA polymerase-3 subunit alpha
MPAIAMTDHGNLFGAIEFYLKAKEAGIKPIIGCELYVAPQSRLARDGGDQDDSFEASAKGQRTPYYHLIVLAQDEAGYRNLMKLVSLAYLEGFYYKPRVDKELLAAYGKGLLATSGCLRGEIPFLLNQGLRDEATQAAGAYQDIFGKDNFFIEIQENGLEQQTRVNRDLVEMSRRLDIPLVATNDCHYLERHDAKAHDVLLCLQTGKTINDPKRMRFSTEELYVKSAEDMARLFGELPQAVRQTVTIAERCNLALDFGTFHLPHYAVPDGTTREAHLQQLAVAGLTERLARMSAAPPTPGNYLASRETVAQYEQRLRDELTMINAMGYAGYFLIVWDIINYARTHGIPVGPGRGSAAGSLVAYALKITDIDPVRYGLIFERFLNPERISLPDIDMDFCMDRRGEVINYVTQKYGADHVAQIITFGTMAAKAAIRDVGRVLDIPYAEVDKVAKLVPTTLNITLDEALAQEPRLRELTETDPRIGELITLAKSLEGLARHASTHAAGVVISKEPLTEHVPLYRGVNGETVTQFAMSEIEKIGLVKFDFLGLRTLTVIDQAVKMINTRQRSSVTLDARQRSSVTLDSGRPDAPPFSAAEIPLDDPKTFALLCTGQTTALFQLESGGMRELVASLRPDRFEDIIAIIALYRPGPMDLIPDFVKGKHGKTSTSYDVPELEEILKETYGVIVYQEQVMAIAHRVAGFSLGQADILRRAMGKKKPEEMARLRDQFVEGARARNLTRKTAEKLFDLIQKFAGYGFNKSHAAAYALLTYQTAYLKAHYPLEFMASLLTSEMGNEDKIVQYLAECRTMGIAILPPDVNESNEGFTIVSGTGDDGGRLLVPFKAAIRFGLVAIKNVGAGAIESVLDARQRFSVTLDARQVQGRFRSLGHFCREVDLRKVNRRVIEGLIKCGAFASTGARRSQLMEALDLAMETGAASQEAHRLGQATLFASPAGEDAETTEDRLPDIPEWDDASLARGEKEALGFYITSHPLAPYAPDRERLGVTPSDRLSERGDGEEIRIWGIIASKKVTTTKKGDRMAYARIEDLTGSVEAIVFPDLYAASTAILASDQPVLVEGTVDKGDKGTKLKATKIVPLDKARERTAGYLEVVLDGVPTEALRQLKATLERHKGSFPVRLRVLLPEHRTESMIVVDDALRVDPTQALIDEIEIGFGKGSAAVKREAHAGRR